MCVCRREQVVNFGEEEQLINDGFLRPLLGCSLILLLFSSLSVHIHAYIEAKQIHSFI